MSQSAELDARPEVLPSRKFLNVIYFQDHGITRSLRFQTRTLFTALGLTGFLFAALLVLGGVVFVKSVEYGKMGAEIDRLQGMVASQQQEFDSQKSEYEQKIAASQKEIQQLLKNDSKDKTLFLTADPYVAEELKKSLEIKDFEISHEASKSSRVRIAFGLYNNAEDDRLVRGKIVVVGRGKGQIVSFPESFSEDGPLRMDVDKGEPFAIRNYRKVVGYFPSPTPDYGWLRDVVVLIYSEKGILIAKKVFKGFQHG
jgi:hypothetical protein